MYVHNANNKSSVFEIVDDKLYINSSANCTFTNSPAIKYSSFLAVQDSSIGDLVTHSLINSLTF